MVKVLAAPLAGMEQAEPNEAFAPERKSQLARLTRPGARRQAIGAELLLQYALRQAGLPLTPWHGAANGKPVFTALPGCHFNLSHSGEWVACALADTPVGVDIQRREKYRPRLVQQFFTEPEAARLERCPEADQDRVFTQLWTVKESYAKMTGEGILALKQQGTVQLQGTTPVLEGVTPDWIRSFRLWEVAADYTLALCVNAPEPLAVTLTLLTPGWHRLMGPD